jgi:plastocyanin
VQFNNSHAEDPHNLWISKAGVIHKFAQVDNGETASKQVALTAGTWKLWCQIEGHEQLGMVASVTVSDGDARTSVRPAG